MASDAKLPHTGVFDLIKEDFPELELTGINFIFNMIILSQNLSKSMEKHFGRYGLTKGKFNVLSYLFFFRNKKMILLSQLAKEIKVTKSTVTGLVDGLENMGYAKRYTDKEIDRRIVCVRITKSGNKFFREFSLIT